MTTEEVDATLESFRNANYFWLFSILLLGLFSNFVRAQRWRLLLQPLGYNPGFWNTFFSINVMFFANLFIPRLGEVTRCGILAKYEDVPVEKSIGTMVVERLIDLICLLSLLGILLICEYDLIWGMFYEKFFGPKEGPQMHIALKYGIPFFILLGLVVVSVYIAKKHGWEQLKTTLITRLKGLWEGVISVKRLEKFGQFIILTIAMWIAYLSMSYVAFFSLEQTTHLGVLPALGCLIFGGFAMVATPGGIGAYPLAIRAILLLYGINETIGGALGTLVWASQTSGVFLSGLLSLILLALTNPSKKK